ncbi:hypothetical protein ABK040_008201 [Willaertia magna]
MQQDTNDQQHQTELQERNMNEEESRRSSVDQQFSPRFIQPPQNKTIWNKLRLETPKSGGSNYFILRLVLDLIMVCVWILWSGLHAKSVSQMLCSPHWTEDYCNSKATGRFFAKVADIFILVPCIIIYGIFILIIRLKIKKHRKYSHYQTWSILLFIVHIYFILLAGLHGINIGLGVTYLLTIGLIFGLLPNLIIIWRFVKLRREQKVMEEAEFHRMFSPRYRDLIATNV